MRKYFEVHHLVNGHCFTEVKPDEEVNANKKYLYADSEDDFSRKLYEYGSLLSKDFEVYASFEGGVADVFFNDDINIRNLELIQRETQCLI